jgi:hypothetical protein
MTISQTRGSRTTGSKAEKPRVVSSFTAEPGAKYPFRQNIYRALLLPDGRLIALSIARDENRQQTMQARYSTDNGHTWTAPEDLFQLPKKAGGFGMFEAMVDQQGEIHIVYLCDANSGRLFPKDPSMPSPAVDVLEIWHVRSRDKLKSWNEPKSIRKGRNSDLLSIIQMKNGRIVLPTNFTNGRSWHKDRGGGFKEFTLMGWFSSGAMYSDDNGETWHESPDVFDVQTPDFQAYGAVEPEAIQLNDGRVWMLLRTQLGRFYESFSNDGARWSAPQPTQLYSSDSPAGLLRLKDGSLMLFSNASQRHPYGKGARYVLHGAISRDEGRTWRGFREVDRDPHRNEPPPRGGDYGLSYPYPTLTQDGHVLYSLWVEHGNIRRFRLIDPAWLLETTQTADFSKDLDEWSIFGSKGVALESAGDDKVLALRKADADWPAAAVWNFPIGAKGHLRFQLKLRSGFEGLLLGLTDHFSVPWDMDAQFYNAFNLPISASELLPGVKLVPERWYKVELSWDTDRGECRVLLDGKAVGSIPDNRRSTGINYLRLRSTATLPDGGIQIRDLSADVSASWPSQ